MYHFDDYELIGAVYKQKTCPCISAGTGYNLPAVPPCLARCALSHVRYATVGKRYADPFTSGRSVSDTLSVRLLSCYTLWQNTFLTFLLALRSPFSLTSSAALSPSAALWGISGNAYSLFVIGLGDSFVGRIVAHKNSFVNSFLKNIFTDYHFKQSKNLL